MCIWKYAVSGSLQKNFQNYENEVSPCCICIFKNAYWKFGRQRAAGQVAEKRGEFHLAFAMYRSKYAVFVKNFSSKIDRMSSVYKALSHFCVIITRASILLTIPVAFIYKNSFLTKAPLPKGGWRREATGGYNIPPPQAVPLPLGEGGFISWFFKLCCYYLYFEEIYTAWIYFSAYVCYNMKNNQFTTKEDVYEIIIIFSFCGVWHQDNSFQKENPNSWNHNCYR